MTPRDRRETRVPIPLPAIPPGARARVRERARHRARQRSSSPRASRGSAARAAVTHAQLRKPANLQSRRPALLVEQCGELLRRQDPVALCHELTDLLPVRVVGEQHRDAITAGARGEERVANDNNTSRSPGSTRNTSSGRGLPVGFSTATSKQNDLRRMSNECAVDLALVRDSSTRTVTSGSARQSARTRSTMSSGTSTGALTRAPQRITIPGPGRAASAAVAYRASA